MQAGRAADSVASRCGRRLQPPRGLVDFDQLLLHPGANIAVCTCHRLPAHTAAADASSDGAAPRPLAVQRARREPDLMGSVLSRRYYGGASAAAEAHAAASESNNVSDHGKRPTLLDEVGVLVFAEQARTKMTTIVPS